MTWVRPCINAASAAYPGQFLNANRALYLCVSGEARSRIQVSSAGMETADSLACTMLTSFRTLLGFHSTRIRHSDSRCTVGRSKNFGRNSSRSPAACSLHEETGDSPARSGSLAREVCKPCLPSSPTKAEVMQLRRFATSQDVRQPWVSGTALRNLWSIAPLHARRSARLALRLAVAPMAISSFVDGVKKALGQVGQLLSS